MNQIRKNLVTNILNLSINVVVGLLYIPYLVGQLGLETYGVLPIALVINQYIIILTDSLSNSVTRFYSVEYRQNRFKQASVYFSSAILLSLLIGIVVVPIIYYFSPGIEHLLRIPDELFSSVKKLILYVVSSLFVAVCSNCVNITIYSDNRLDLINYLKIIRNSLKLILNVVLFTTLTIDVSNVGLASLLTEILILITSISFYRRTKCKEIKFNLLNFDIKAMNPVFKMITWVSLISLSNVFIYKIDTILVNNYFGLYYTGILGSMSEFGAYCISIVSVLGVLYRPIMLISYSEGRHEDLKKLTIGSSYVVGLLSCLLCGIVMGLAHPLLSIWLNDEVANYSYWMVIKMFMIPITTFGSVYSIIYNLFNKVKLPAVGSLLIADIYTIVSITLLELGMNMTCFLILGCVAAISQGALLHLFVYRKIYPNTMPEVYTKMFKCVAYLILIIILSSLVEYFIQARNLYTLILEAFLSGALGLALLFSFITREDLDMLDIVFPIKSVLHKLNITLK